MPGATMESGVGKAFPPHCFCFKPAVEVYTEGDGLVYECHYTNPRLWLEQPSPLSPLPQYQRQQQPVESSPSIKTLATTITSSASSFSTSPQLPPLSQLSTPTVASTPHVLTADFLEIRQFIESLQGSNKGDLPSTWGRPMRGQPRVIDSNRKRDTDNRSNANYITGGPSAFNGNSIAHGDNTGNGGIVTNGGGTTNGVTATNGTSCTNGTSAYKGTSTLNGGDSPYSRSVYHSFAGQGKSPIKISDSEPSQPSDNRQALVCGFHMHTDDWGRFKYLVKSQGPTHNSVSLNQQAALAAQHHEIVIKFTDIRKQMLRVAKEHECHASAITIRRWIDCKGEEVAERTFPQISGATSGMGGAPICFCRERMRLSMKHNERGSNVAFFCAARLADAKGGCSRVLNAGNWVQWQILEPIHPLAVIPSTSADSLGADNTLDTVAEYCFGDKSPSDTGIRHTEQDKFMDELDDEVREQQADFVDPESERVVPEAVDVTCSAEEGWDQDITASSGVTSTKPRLRSLPLPPGLIMCGDRIVRADSRSGGLKAAIPKSEDNAQPGDSNSQGENETSNQWWEGNSLNSTELWPLSLSTAIPADGLKKLERQLYDLHNILIPNGMRTETGLQELEARVSKWRDSCGRLKEYTQLLHGDGLDNPTLKCRRCKEGPLLHANFPCFHLVMCDDCIKGHPQCVICHATIKETRRTYWG
ncbi:hypothetical protein EDD21DRAFT_376347 [Dissophora ornata]|nr:hypothetical protein EDD21DRAFT_376347 [Dissophora ornata]